MSSMIGSSGFTPQNSGLKNTGYRSVNVGADPRIQQLWQMLMGGASPGLSGGLNFLSKLSQGGDEDFWRQQEAPAMRQFGQMQGQIASRFSGNDARRSSGFQNELGGEASSLAERLQSNRMELQQNAINQLMQLSQNLLGTNLSQNYLTPKKSSGLKDLLASLSGGFAKTGGMGLGSKLFRGMF
jgi:hypothetical protein